MNGWKWILVGVIAVEVAFCWWLRRRDQMRAFIAYLHAIAASAEAVAESLEDMRKALGDIYAGGQMARLAHVYIAGPEGWRSLGAVESVTMHVDPPKRSGTATR